MSYHQYREEHDIFQKKQNDLENWFNGKELKLNRRERDNHVFRI